MYINMYDNGKTDIWVLVLFDYNGFWILMAWFKIFNFIMYCIFGS